jgi:hypothetical protein
MQSQSEEFIFEFEIAIPKKLKRILVTLVFTLLFVFLLTRCSVLARLL